MEMIKGMWLDFFQNEPDTDDWWARKKQLWEERDAKIVRIQGNGEVFQESRYDNQSHYHYLLHVSFLIKQKERFHVEEIVIPYQYRFAEGKITDHKALSRGAQAEEKMAVVPMEARKKQDQRFTYNRLAAVQYAERWWNSYNPDYRTFDVDCTNYVSQCLIAGGAQMHGAPVREQGWWYSGDNWSFSWAVAHSMRWYLSGAEQGLYGKETDDASELLPGDIICYDFQGDGRWDHNTIVVAKDAYGMPLVNAHTDNSRNRYWSYEDSTAWTPEINYKFFRIGEN